ncbi:hypothetical protein HRI_005280500 [Hibiscus trionum]|uniref:Uncharacterized protein n=1 Tax=Hibiscus trionum TaxID=183268 RepID=A0A9W7JJY2_HIBTR|nr:hypothetical protein HRI_005280500 [Hibiscus trionum]
MHYKHISKENRAKRSKFLRKRPNPQVNIQPVGDCEWSDIQATEARIADVREIAPEAEGSSHDISVVSPAIDNQHDQGTNSFHQP